MNLDSVPQTYSEALEEGYSTFETEYSDRGGWKDITSLFRDAFADEIEAILDNNTSLEAMGIEPNPEDEIIVNTGEILLQGESNSEEYLAVLYKDLGDGRRPVAKAHLTEHEAQQDDRGSREMDKSQIPDSGEMVEFDRNNVLELLDQG